MAFIRLLTSRTARTSSMVMIGGLFVLQLVVEALRVARIATDAPGAFWAWYATYALIGVLFFLAGSLTWLYGYARQRTVATLLFWFCNLSMFAFGTLSGDRLGDSFSNALGSTASALAVLCLFLLLLRFPRSVLPQSAGGRRVIGVTQASVCVLCLFSASYSMLHDFFAIPLPGWWRLLGVSYYGVAGLLIVLIVALAARRSTSVRTLQQTRLFFAGTLLAIVPILIATVLPALLHLRIYADGAQSMVTLIFFPLSTGYSLLRYNLLIFDVYVRRVVTWVIGAVSLALLGYVLFSISSQLVGGNVSLILAALVGAGVLSAPYIWWLARRLTDRFFFPEAAFYAIRLKEARARQGLETFDLQLAAHQLALDALTALYSPAVCIFLLDEQVHAFRLVPLTQLGQQADAGLLAQLDRLFTPAPGETAPCIAEQDLSIAQLSTSRRPLFLSEVTDGKGVGLARYMKNRARGSAPDPLLAPLRTPQGKLIGVVAIGERGDRQLYAGPELEALQHLVDRAASAIETARLYELTTRQQAASRRELEQAYEQQRRLNEEKDQFIIHVSHELRTPLSEVTGYLDLLAASGEELDPELRALFIQKAQHGSEELQGLVESILDAAQSSFASPLPLHIEAVALAPIVQETLAHLDPQAAQEHAIEVQVADCVRVLADGHALRLILGNLLSNALKYTPAGTPIRVCAITDQEDGVEEAPVVCMQVKDEGPGIPPAEAPLLFGKFARLQRDLNGSIRGTGLGLYINKQLVEGMGGRIWVESSGVNGEGSLFAFTLRQAGVPQSSTASAESVLV